MRSCLTPSRMQSPLRTFTRVTVSKRPFSAISSHISGCQAPGAFLRLSQSRRSFWYTGFSTPQSGQKRTRSMGIVYLSTIFLMPSLCVYFGATPALLNWWMQTYRLVEYPPQADPAIIRAIFNDKTPPSSSLDSETNTNR